MPDNPLTDEALAAMDADTLEAELRRHNRLYWDLARPEISDYDYDRLVERLRALRPDAPALQEMGPSGVGLIGEAVQHAAPMLSLDKCYAYQEEDSSKQSLFNWAHSSSRAGGQVSHAPRFEGDVVVTPKMDGIACSLRYDDEGVLHIAATRGSGKEGDNITANARTIRDIPKVLARPGVEVRGEIYMRLSVFAGFADQFSNPRNLTAGAIKQKDPLNTRAYKLSFAAYDILGADDLETEEAKFTELARLGFPEMDFKVVGLEQLMLGYEHFASHREDLDYEIDGVVYKVNRADQQRLLGATAHHPRYAIAFKFQGDQKTTTLEAVDWSVARSGAITPVASIAPVELSGAMISNASLHNAGFLKYNLGLLGEYPGAEVLVTRRGGVIPKVEFVVKHVTEPAEGAQPIAYPKECPSCGGPVRLEINEKKKKDKETGEEYVEAVFEFLYCENPETCQHAAIGALAHYAKALDIMGFGDKLLTQAYDQGLLRTAADFYSLQAGDLLGLERVGEKLAEKLINEVHSRQEVPVETFLRALGVEELSHFVSGKLAQEFETIERIRSVTYETLIPGEKASDPPLIKGIGKKVARKVVDGLAAKAELIDALLAHVTALDHVPEEKPTGDAAPLAGVSFVFTGALEQMTRKEAQQRVKALGGDAPSSVGKGLSYLVVGGDPDAKKSSKQKKAEAFIGKGATTKIITEAEFLAMLEGQEGQLSLF